MQDAQGNKMEPLNSLSDAYLLRERDDQSSEVSLNAKIADGFRAFSEEKEVIPSKELLSCCMLSLLSYVLHMCFTIHMLNIFHIFPIVESGFW